jgi:hypothetical protein
MHILIEFAIEVHRNKEMKMNRKDLKVKKETRT